mmetsp:Transcript_3132/g.8481  ORF Transcript_3132/g.8481 Transcript_3132/m.8481 type:complete len:332 (+) Transcript_3132:601-1596(+)
MTGIVIEHNVEEICGLPRLFRNISGIAALVGVGFVDVPLDEPDLIDRDLPPRGSPVLEGPGDLPPDEIVALEPPRRIAGVLDRFLVRLAFLGAPRRVPGRLSGEVPKVLQRRLLRLEDRPARGRYHEAGSLAGGAPGGVEPQRDGQLGGVFPGADILLRDLVLRRVVPVVDDAVKELVVVFLLRPLRDGGRPPLVLVVHLDDLAFFEPSDRREQVRSGGAPVGLVSAAGHTTVHGAGIQGSLLFEEKGGFLGRFVVQPHVFFLVLLSPERVDPILDDLLFLPLFDDHGSFDPPVHWISEGVCQLLLADDRRGGIGIGQSFRIDLRDGGRKR